MNGNLTNFRFNKIKLYFKNGIVYNGHNGFPCIYLFILFWYYVSHLAFKWGYQSGRAQFKFSIFKFMYCIVVPRTNSQHIVLLFWNAILVKRCVTTTKQFILKL